ncbi:reverse transcriptase domain-containing protein [Tanacetum coccineum]
MSINSGKLAGSKSASKAATLSGSSQPKSLLFLDQLYPFRLIEFDQVEPANNKYLIDIAGYVTNVGRTSYTKSGSKTLEFYLANQRGQSLGVTLWGELGDVLVEKKTKHAGVCAMVLTGMSGKEYNIKLYLSSTSSTVFYDDDDIPCLRVAPSKAPLPIDCSQPREGTLENLLIWARNRQNNVWLFLPVLATCYVSFRPDTYLTFVFADNDLSLKGAKRKLKKWVCEACNRAADYPVFRYRLEAVVADDTAHTVVVMFNDTATELLKCSAESLMGTEDEYSDADTELNLPVAIRNLIGTTHVLEIKSHTYYEYGTFESFNCWKINPNASAKDDASSSTPAVTANDAEPSMKIVTKPPTVCTPLKPNEEKKQKGHDLEDSDVDEVRGPLKNKGKSNADVVVDTKKKRKRDPLILFSHNNQRITPSLRDLLQNPVRIHANTIIDQDGRIQSTMNTASRNNQRMTPSFIDMLQNSVRIHTNTIIRQDGRVQSYCGLRLTETATDYSGPSTSKYASTRLPRRSTGPTHLRGAKKGTQKAAFTSTGRAPYTFRINGQNYHRTGSLLPKEGMPPKFAQLYFFDTQNEVRNQASAFIDKETSEGIDIQIIGNLINILDWYSLVAQAFRIARDWCNTHSWPDFRLRLHSERKTTRQYNAPTMSEVASININDFGDAHPTREIVVDRKDTGPQCVSELHPSYMALQYPLLFPYGEDGFHEKIPYHTNTGTRKTKQGYVMTTPVISISSDVSVESVGSSFPRIILIDSIFVEVLIAPKVGAAAVASPAGVLELDTHSSLEADPSESSLPPVSVAPMVSPFLCLDDSESYTEMPERHVSPIPHDDMLTRWRSKVTSRSSTPTTSTLEIPIAPILPAPPTDIISPDIPISRLYRTHPGRPCRALTARKSVRPLSSHRLALRSFINWHSISGHSLSRHSPLDTTIADSSAPPRFVYLPLAKTPRCSEAYRHWRSALLSTIYPLTTSESSIRDSSFESSAGPSHKRYRSLAATMTSSIHAMRALVPSRANILPPRKRFRDSISLEDSVEEDIDADELADIEADTTVVEVAVDRDVVARVDAGIDMEVEVGVNVEEEVEDKVESSDRCTMEVGVDVITRIDIPDGMLMPDVVECLEQVEEVLQDIYRHVIEIPLQRIEDIDTGQREFRRCMSFMESELRQIRRFRYYDRMRFRRLETFTNMTITRSGMTSEAIEKLVNRRVEEALAAYEVTRDANTLEAESQSQNGNDSDNGNGGNGNGGDGNPNENDRGARLIARECTFQDFMKCQPLNFKGMEGVVLLIRWFEKMETVFHISNCPKKYQVKYATCTLLNSALTWWNSHKRTIGTDDMPCHGKSL